MIIPPNFIKLKDTQFSWGSRGDLVFIDNKWQWIGMCSFRVGGHNVISPNKRITKLRRGDVVQIKETNDSTFGFEVVTAVSPDNDLFPDRVDLVRLKEVSSVETLRTRGIGMPIKYLKRFGWNLIDLPYLLPTIKTFGLF